MSCYDEFGVSTTFTIIRCCLGCRAAADAAAVALSGTITRLTYVARSYDWTRTRMAMETYSTARCGILFASPGGGLGLKQNMVIIIIIIIKFCCCDSELLYGTKR